MKIGIVRAPNLGSTARGAGTYYEELVKHLRTIKNLELIPRDFSPLSTYFDLDVIHFAYFDPFFLTLPPLRQTKTVVTVYDLTPILFPKSFPKGVKGSLKWQTQKRLLASADAVITISNCAKADIEKLIKIPGEKIFVTHLAASEIFRPIERPKNKFNLPKKFVLYVGGVNWNKNLPVLVRACQKTGANLVLVGREFGAENANLAHPENASLKEILKLVKHARNVRLLGFVPREDLVDIYNLASVYVQPSVYEGFGLPVLEAMACGTPVICGNNSSFPEIAGEAATYADVTSVSDLADKIAHVKKTGKEIAQAKSFSWEKTARKTYEIYQKVLARK